MSFLFSGRDSVVVPPIRVPSRRGSGRSRMAGERPFSSEPETESSESVMEETSEREGRGRRAGRRSRRRV